jgi:hypothetical protein
MTSAAGTWAAPRCSQHSKTRMAAASRKARLARTGGYTAGVPAQTNFGGELRMNGAPVGRELRTRGRNSGNGHTVEGLPTDRTVEKRCRALP